MWASVNPGLDAPLAIASHVGAANRDNAAMSTSSHGTGGSYRSTPVGAASDGVGGISGSIGGG